MTLWWRAALIQAVAWILARLLADGFDLTAALIAAVTAGVLSLVFKEPRWRSPMQSLFALGLYLGLSTERLPPSTWLILLLISIPLFGAGVVGRRRAPLYLTDKKALMALLRAIPETESGRCLDVGAGLGSFIRHVAPLRPHLQFEGVESAPMTCLIGNLLCRASRTGRIFYGDLWTTSLAPYRVVYAFLSPEAMPELWLKAKGEMAPGSLLIVHAFLIPGVAVEAKFDYGASPTSVIYRYRI